MIVDGKYVDDTEYLNLETKGGAGSGSWNGPNSPRFARQGRRSREVEAEKITSDIKVQTQLLWDKHFPGKKVNITCDCEETSVGTLRVTTEIKARGFIKGDTVMMSTIDQKRKEITHDLYFLDDDKLKKKGFSSSHIGYLEKIAKDKGCTKAVLRAADQGRWTWPKMGFKCSSRKDLLNIIAFGQTKGIEIKNEKDFYKLKEFFLKKAGLKYPEVDMSKKL